MSSVELHCQSNSQVGGLVDVCEGSNDDPRSIPARIFTMSIRSYQAARSGRPTGCRYFPTCSEYAVEAVSTYGPCWGFLLATRRIARCGPWGGHGIDPVPERKNS